MVHTYLCEGMAISHVDWYVAKYIAIKENLFLRNAIPAARSTPEDEGNVVTAVDGPVVSSSNGCRIDAFAEQRQCRKENSHEMHTN